MGAGEELLYPLLYYQPQTFHPIKYFLKRSETSLKIIKLFSGAMRLHWIERFCLQACSSSIYTKIVLTQRFMSKGLEP